MRSIQAKIVLIFSVLIVITMQFIAAFLLRSLEDYFITEQERRLTYEARVLSGELASLMAGPVDDGGGGGVSFTHLSPPTGPSVLSLGVCGIIKKIKCTN